MISCKLRELRKSKGITQVRLAEMLGVTQSAVTNWEKGKSVPDYENQQKLADIYGISIDELLGREAPIKEKGIKIPVLGRVQAGIPVEAIEEIIDYEEISTEMSRQGEYFGLIVRGDSMSPVMTDGDTVIIKKQDDCENGDIAVILVNGNDATVKKIRKGPTGITLIPINTAYDYMTYSNNDIETLPVSIIGKVVELRRKF
ncbi:MAG: helix-turn-helix domain-containing protein [Oscillospiraceae bacterium]|nr:helix-turn-helix domain-containing protein [Oscillospiraceae bacterium]